jgi:hypothetical protein
MHIFCQVTKALKSFSYKVGCHSYN